jgi:hypothetical protein
MAFFDNFYEDFGELQPSTWEPLKPYCVQNQPGVRVRGDGVLAQGYYVPIIFQGINVHPGWVSVLEPLLREVKSRDLDCLNGKELYKIELSIIPPNSLLDWHHDIYLKDKLTERLHVPLVTSSNTTFYAQWFDDPQVYGFRMKAGNLYRLNNRVPHTVENEGTEARFHLMLNYMKADILEELKQSQYHMDRTDPRPNSGVQRAITAVTPLDDIFFFSKKDPVGCFRASKERQWPALSKDQIMKIFNTTNSIKDLVR